jgi:hypothetical protein
MIKLRTRPAGKACSFKGKSYPSGYELRKGDQAPEDQDMKDRVQICIDGEWFEPTKIKIPGILVE